MRFYAYKFISSFINRYNRYEFQHGYLVNIDVLELIFERGDDSLEVNGFEALDFLRLRFLHPHCSRCIDFHHASQ